MSWRSTCPGPRSVSVVLVSILAFVACGPERPADTVQGSPPASRAGESVESATGADTAPASAVRLKPGSQQPVEPVGEYPFENFNLPDDGEADRPVVRHELRIENRLTHVIVVAATAGAAPVVLDSLDPGEVVRLDVEAPADRLVLQWQTTDGSASGTRLVEALADSVQVVRIEVVPGPG